MWDENGGTDKEYFYMDAENSLTGVAGWFEDDFETAADDVEISKGSCVAFQSLGTTSIQFAGQVASKSVAVTTLPAGFTMIGNVTPVEIKLGDLVLENACACDSIQFMDENGGTDKEYFYMDAENSLTGVAGWFEDDFETDANDVVIKAGSGVLYQAIGGEVVITIPAAIK